MHHITKSINVATAAVQAHVIEMIKHNPFDFELEYNFV